MLSFRQYLEESRTLEIGQNPKHDQYRKSHEDQMHDVIKKSYDNKELNGYMGLGSGTKEESDAIRSDIRNPNHHIQATIDRGKITSVIIKKKARSPLIKGRKLIAAGTDSSNQGKTDLKRNLIRSKKRQNVHAEVSGALEKLMQKMNYPTVPSKEAGKILGKVVKPTSDTTYSRDIGGHPHEKTLVGSKRKKTLDNPS